MTDDRKTYLGGPGAAAVLGVHPNVTGVDEWLRLTGRAAPVPDNPDFRRGRLLERSVLDYASEELKEPVLPGPFVRDARLEIAGGHLDGLTERTANVVEAKTSRTRQGWGEPGTDEVPPHIATQALWYLGLMPHAEVCWIPVLFSGLEFQMFRVERNDALIEQIRNLAWRWWQDYVLTDTPPPPQTGADAAALFPRDTGRVVIADDATVEAVVQLRELKTLAKDIEAKIEDRESRIKLALGDASVLTIGGETAATWKVAKSSRFDSSAFKSAHGDLYSQFTRPIESRRFLLK